MATQDEKTVNAEDKELSAFTEEEQLNESSLDDTGENDITPVELDLLDNAKDNEYTSDDQLLEEALLDDTDDDGDMLNEENDISGEDLDVPGGEAEDDDESLVEEDEENSNTSTRDQDDESDNDPL